MKDFIYFDQNAINSFLAQNGAGYIQTVANSNEKKKANTTTHEDEADFTMAIKAILNAGTSIKSTDMASEALSKTQSDLINKAIGDYSLDLVLSQNPDWNENISQSQNGEYFKITSSSCKFIDFNLVGEITDPKRMADFINSSSPEYEEYKKMMKKKGTKGQKLTSEELLRLKTLEKEIALPSLWNQLSQYGKFGSLLFPNSLIFKINGGLAFIDSENLRLNTSQLYMLNSSERNMVVVGQVSQIQKHVHSDGQMENDLALSDYGKVPVIMSEIILGSSELLNEGDRIFRPFAIYFE